MSKITEFSKKYQLHMMIFGIVISNCIYLVPVFGFLFWSIIGIVVIIVTMLIITVNNL